jgi:hypothetical protein
VALLEAQCLVDLQAKLAGDHVDGAGKQVGFQRGGVRHGDEADALEGRRRAVPGGVRLQHDLAAGRDPDDAVGPEEEAGIGGIGIEGGALAPGRGIGLEDRPLEMRRQQLNRGGREVVLEAILVDRESLVVDHVDREDAAEALARDRAGERVAPDLPGEDHVGAGDRRAVAPGGFGVQLVGDGNALRAAWCRLQLRQAVLQAWHLDAQHADQLPVVVVGGDRTARHAVHVALRHAGLGQQVEGAGKLAEADAQLARPTCLRDGGHEGDGQEQGCKQAGHRRTPPDGRRQL